MQKAPPVVACLAFVAVVGPVVLGALAPAAGAQIRFYTVDGVGAPPEFCGVGDVDGDGHDDFAHTADPVRVTSGADGVTTLFDVAAPAPLIAFGRSLDGAGDVNGDGRPDLLVGAPLADFAGVDAGLVRMVSGLDGSELFTVHGLAADERLGHDVASVDDLDGDGTPDFLASAGDFKPSEFVDHGLVRLYSGADGAILHEWIGPTDNERFGFTVSAAGDVDADGQGDVMIGSLDNFLLRVYSGLDFSLLHTLESSPYDIEPAGDLDGDGHDDIGTLIGWPLDGVLRVYSGETGEKIRDFGSAFSTAPAASIAAPGDLDADGVPDYLLGQTGISSDEPGFVQLFSGATGSPIDTVYELPSFWDSSSSFGGRVDVVGDIDGNGLLDFGSTTTGNITFLAGNFSPMAAFAEGPVRGAIPATLTGGGPLLPDSPLGLHATQLPATHSAFLVVGLSRLDAPFKGGTMVPAIDALAGPFVTDEWGNVTLQGRWPAGLPVFFSVWFQAWAADGASPTGFRATNGVVGTQY